MNAILYSFTPKEIASLRCSTYSDAAFTPSSFPKKIEAPFKVYIYNRATKLVEGYFTTSGSDVTAIHFYADPRSLYSYYRPCISPKIPYCPSCPLGYEYISEDEAEFYRLGEGCSTEWICRNKVKNIPKPWFYVLDEEFKS